MTIANQQLVKLAVSVGEPAGIGPDGIIMLMQAAQSNIVVAFCDPNLLAQRALKLGLKIHLEVLPSSDLSALSNLSLLPAGSIYVLDTAKENKPKDYPPGILDSTGLLTIEYLDAAVTACLNGYCDALVTCPIQKSSISKHIPDFIGHTEYLAEHCNNHKLSNASLTDSNLLTTTLTPPFESVMVLMNQELKVALVTTHIPLSKVCSSITQENIIEIAKIIHHELTSKFGISNPHILITGLNPHAGEDGVLGLEEQQIITPAIKKLVGCQINATGPYAADSLFSKQFADDEIVLAMYHDQGLTGFKARSFNTAANVTLGLPIIRTSVDHGTALDKAGTGNINIESLKFAMQTASQLAKTRRKFRQYG